MDFRKHLRCAQKQNRLASGVKSNMTSEIKRAYQILELEPGASLEQVKQAWREQVKVWHPDRFPNDAKMQRKAQERLKDINGAYEILCQFLADGTSPRGSRAKSSDTKSETDQKTREAKAEQNQPPPPSNGSHGIKSSKSPKRSKAKVAFLLILTLVILTCCAHLAVKYHAFTNQISVVRNIHIGDSREEVTYRLGVPTFVLGAPEKGEYGWWQHVFKVNADKSDIDAMPSSTKIEGYGEWQYQEPNSPVSLTIEFNKSGIVKSLQVYCDSSVRYAWGPVAGIYCGDSEEEILRLGKPSKQHLDGVSKTIEYRDIGVEVTLTKGIAYIIKIQGPQSEAAVFSYFLRSYF
jgi:hypothetical protein